MLNINIFITFIKIIHWLKNLNSYLLTKWYRICYKEKRKFLIMNTLQDVITESSNYLEEHNKEEIISQEERTNIFLDNIILLHNDIDKYIKHYEKGITLLEKFTWVTDKGEFGEEEFTEIKKIKIAGLKAHKRGIKDYVYFNNKFRSFAAKKIRVYKNTLDEFKETLEIVYNLLLNNYSDIESLDIEKRLKDL